MTRIVVESSLKGKEKSLLDAAFPQRCLAMVCDPQTHAALGERVSTAMSVARCTYIVLPSRPAPDVATLNAIRRQAKDCTAYIAIGSGTINDLCKRAAFLDGKPYGVFPTAPSMNGYISANASLYGEGAAVKESVPAAPPAWVWADLEVLAAAPPRLIRSGLGDSLCRPTAQVDWLMSHELLGTAYDALPFRWLAEHEETLLRSAERLTRGDIAAVEILFRSLMISGQGMTQAGGSYPASQGEHMIAHAYEHMHHLKHETAADVLHGELIAVTTLSMATLQQRLLTERIPLFHYPKRPDAGKMKALFGAASAEYLPLYQRKMACIEAALEHMPKQWSATQEKLRACMMPMENLKSVMEAAGLATSPQALKLDEVLYENACRYAYATRDRFTFLDLEQMLDQA